MELSGGWYSSCSENENFIIELLTELNNQIGHDNVGIYTDIDAWNKLVCGWTGASSHLIWYASIDGAANFNDWKSFGGWTAPAIKQYYEDNVYCGTGYDKDYD